MEKLNNLYTDAEKVFFEKLPQEDQENRILKLGKEGAIQGYGYEIALQSKEYPEKELSVEEREVFEKLKVGFSNVVKSFSLKRSPDNKSGENLLAVTDGGASELMIRALSEVGREFAGSEFRLVVAPKTEHASQEFGNSIGDKMKNSDAILLMTSLSRSHSKETVEVTHPKHNADVINFLLNSPILINAYPELRKKDSSEITKLLDKRKIEPSSPFPSKSRLISITNTDIETLTMGAALEDPMELTERIDNFAEKIAGVTRVKIKSALGSDAQLNLYIKTATLMKENGVVSSPGQAVNFPSGEYGGAVNLENTSGVYVVDGAVGMIGRVDEPIRITIENGLAVKIEGGRSAERLLEILNKANADYKLKSPTDEITSAFRVAEFSFGMNSKAFRYAEDGKKIVAPTSLEAEKGIGTVHIALGKNTFFGVSEDDPDCNNIPIHIDCVSKEISVVGIKDDGEEISIIENGNFLL